MRWKQAIRFCQFLFKRQLITINYFAVLSCFDIVQFEILDGVYTVSVNVEGRLITSSSKNAYEVIKYFGKLLSNKVWYIQGGLMSRKGNNELGLFIHKQIPEDKRIELLDVDPTNPPDQPLVDKENYIELDEEHFFPEEKNDINNWHYTDEITDFDLRTEALTSMLFEHDALEEEDYLNELWNLTVIQVWLSNDEQQEVKKITKEGLYSLPITENSSGLLPLDSTEGLVNGSKTLMADAAVDCAMFNDQISVTTMSRKREVVKKGKKARYIFLEPQNLYLLNSYFFQKSVKRHGHVCDGDGRGLSMMNGDMLKPWLNMMCALSSVKNLELEESLDYLDNLGCNESDKTKWEYLLREHVTQSFELYRIWEVKPHEDDIIKFANILAHGCCPYIQYHNNWCVPGKGKVASGTFETARKNTMMHRAGFQRALMIVIEHDYKIGKDCKCRFCKRIGKEVNFTKDEILLASAYVCMGDDFLGLNIHSEVLNTITDEVLGSCTKTEVLPAFGKPGVACAKFLQRSVRREGNRLTVFRDTNRLLGKFYHGAARLDYESILDALRSLALDCGDNERVNEIARHQFDYILGSPDFKEFEQNVGSLDKTPPEKLNTVVWLQNQLNRALFDMASNWTMI